MTGSLLPQVFNRSITAGGVASPGAKLFFYATGGLIAAPVYTTSALNVAHAQPVVADSGGLFAPIYLDPNTIYRVILKTSADIAVQDIDPVNGASVSGSGGADLVGFLQAGSGAVSRTVQSKLRDTVSAADFGASTSASAADNTTATQAAIDAMNARSGGGRVMLPFGNLAFTNLVWKANVEIQGEGKNSSILTTATLNDGIKFSGLINAQNLANTALRDFKLVCSNASNVAGAGYCDEGGSFVEMTNVLIHGFGYGVIFDQTECADIDLCTFESQNTACGWLVNGPGRRALASYFYTNRISVRRSQIDQGVTANAGFIDDGGYAHIFEGNNFNGGDIQLRVAGTSGLIVSGSEWEGNTTGNPIIRLTNTDSQGNSPGSPTGTVINGNLMAQSTGSPCIDIVAASGIVVSGNYLQTASSVKIAGLANAGRGAFVAGNYLNGSGALCDGVAFEGQLTLANGSNNNIPVPVWQGMADAAQFLTVTGPSGAFSLTGLVAEYSGRWVTIHNASGFTMTIPHNSGSSSAGNKFILPGGVDMILPSGSGVAFRYEANSTGWVVVGSGIAPLQNTATFDPINLADGAGDTTTIAVTGAALGDFAVATFSLDLQGITLTAWVSAADTVSVRFQNESGGALNLASGTLKARVIK